MRVEGVGCGVWGVGWVVWEVGCGVCACVLLWNSHESPTMLRLLVENSWLRGEG